MLTGSFKNLYVCVVYMHVGMQANLSGVHVHMYGDECGDQRLALDVFLNGTPPYWGSVYQLNPELWNIAWFS